MIGNLCRFFWIDVESFGKDSFGSSLRNHLEALAAAHPLLQIVPPFRERVFDNRQHRFVALREQHVTRSDKNLHLIRLCSRLIKALAEIVQAKGHEIDDALAGDPQPLPLFLLQNPRRNSSARYDSLRQPS